MLKWKGWIRRKTWMHFLSHSWGVHQNGTIAWIQARLRCGMMMQTSIDTLWDPTKILEYLPKKTKIQIFDRNLDPTFTIETQTKGIRVTPWPMIIIESQTKGIKFERHKEKSLISSQFLKKQKKSKASPFLIFIQ